ncbi:MAG TPA: hypothetical protein VF519_00900 [Mycobacteriales bacterium]
MQKKLFHAFATVATGVVAALSLMPAQAAHANHVLTVCDNGNTSGTVPYRLVPLPGGIGTVEVHVGTAEDSWVSYNGPGTPLDTLVGIDLNTLSLADNMTFCLRAPIVGSYTVTVNVIGLDVEICSWAGEPGHGAIPTCTKVV